MIYYRLAFCFATALFLAITGAFAQNPDWVNSIYNTASSSSGSARPTCIATDLSGNTYVAARTTGEISLGGAVYQGNDNTVQHYLVKYTQAGSVAWVKPIVATIPINNNGLSVRDLETDNAGNLYATGSFTDTIMIDGNVYSTVLGFRDFFVAKWNANGTLAWFRKGGGSGYRDANTLFADASGNVFIGGNYTTTSGFGNTILSAGNAQPHAFIAKLAASNGAIEWARGAVNFSNGSAQVNSIGAVATGAIYAQGSFTNGFVWDNVPFSPPGGTTSGTTFWVKFNAAGTALQGLTIPVANITGTSASMVVDAAGNSYLTNSFSDSVNLGGIILAPSFNTGIYVAKYNSSGVLQWAKQVEASLGPNYTELVSRSIAVDNAGRVYLGGYFKGNFVIDFFDVFGQINTFSGFAACFDQFTGTPLWVIQTLSQGNAADTRIAASANGHLSLSGSFSGSPVTIGNTSTGSGAQPGLTSLYVARILQEFNSISGKVFRDVNSNGLLDIGEGPMSAPVMVQVGQGSSVYSTGTNGNYIALTGTGAQNVTIPAAPLYYNAVPAGQTAVTFQGFGNSAAGFDFALQPVANQQDLQVFVTPLMAVRPGFTTSVRVTYKNTGTVTIPSGTITLSFDPLLTYLSSSPSGSVAGSTITWNYTNLLPDQTRNINLIFNAPASAPLGDSVIYTASVTPLSGDLTPQDNTESVSRVITGSFDPNMLEVNLDEISPSQVQNGQWLYYTVHFQNLGTDTAITVMLRDSLPAGLLRLNTIQMVAASHNNAWSLGANGMLTVTFNNIRLPHQGINAINSNGFIRFRIKPQPNLVIGDIIPNQARIYFDYNPYIATNTTQTLVKLLTGTEDNLSKSLTVFPNPAADKLTIAWQFGQGREVDISLVNALGQQALKTRIAEGNGYFSEEISLAGLPAGVYKLVVKTETEIRNCTIIIQ